MENEDEDKLISPGTSDKTQQEMEKTIAEKKVAKFI